MIEGIDSGAVSVVPVDAYSVLAHLFHGNHFQSRLVHWKQFLLPVVCLLWFSAVRSGAGGTGAFVAQITQSIVTVVTVAPIDFDAARF